jgi:hypothetical protein
VERADITQPQYDEMDTNSDGELSESELEVLVPRENPFGCNLP